MHVSYCDFVCQVSLSNYKYIGVQKNIFFETEGEKKNISRDGTFRESLIVHFDSIIVSKKVACLALPTSVSQASPHPPHCIWNDKMKPALF